MSESVTINYVIYLLSELLTLTNGTRYTSIILWAASVLLYTKSFVTRRLADMLTNCTEIFTACRMSFF